jgi:acyl carrier protein
MTGSGGDAVTETEIRSRLRSFVGRACHGREFADLDDIFELGFVTSLFALELVTFVESSFAVTIETEDLELDNFRTLDAMVALVARKSGAGR